MTAANETRRGGCVPPRSKAQGVPVKLPGYSAARYSALMLATEL